MSCAKYFNFDCYCQNIYALPSSWTGKYLILLNQSETFSHLSFVLIVLFFFLLSLAPGGASCSEANFMRNINMWFSNDINMYRCFSNCLHQEWNHLLMFYCKGFLKSGKYRINIPVQGTCTLFCNFVPFTEQNQLCLRWLIHALIR